MLNYGTDNVVNGTGYGDWADRAEPGNMISPSQGQARIGISPLDEYPSRWFNYFHNYNSRNINEMAKCFLDLYKELIYLLQMAGLAPNKMDSTQVYTALVAIIHDFDISDKKVSFVKSTVLEQIASNSTLSKLFGTIMRWYDEIEKHTKGIDDLRVKLNAEIQREQTRQNQLIAKLNSEYIERLAGFQTIREEVNGNKNNIDGYILVGNEINSQLTFYESTASLSLFDLEQRTTSIEDVLRAGPDGVSIIYNGTYWVASETWLRSTLASGSGGGDIYQHRVIYTVNQPGMLTFLRYGCFSFIMYTNGGFPGNAALKNYMMSYRGDAGILCNGHGAFYSADGTYSCVGTIYQIRGPSQSDGFLSVSIIGSSGSTGQVLQSGTNIAEGTYQLTLYSNKMS